MSANDAKLSAYLDGELDAADRAAVEAELARSPQLRQRLERMRQVDRSLAEVYGSINERPLPASLTALLEAHKRTAAEESGDTVVALRPRRPAAQPVWQLPLAASIALALGLGLGLGLGDGAERPMVAAVEQALGRVAADNPLHRVLEEAPSGRTVPLGEAEGLTATPVLSFRSQTGGYCRELLVQGDGAAARSLACRTPETDWQVRVMAATEPTAAEGYRPAAGDLAPAVDRAVDALIAGDPLGAEEEARLIARRWRQD